MDTLFATPEMLLRIVVLFLYFPICPIIYWWLVLRLPQALRRLALVMLAAQLLVIGVALFHTTSSKHEEWFWRLDSEWNIPSLIASAHFALVGGVALLTARLARAHTTWHRVYLVGIGILFAVFALDEYFGLKDHLQIALYIPYLIFGPTLAAVTLMVVETSPRQARLWLLYLLMGLSIVGFGGLVIDKWFANTTLEEITEMVGCWVALVAMLGHFSEVVPRPSLRLRRSMYLIPPVWILLLFLTSGMSPVHVYTGSQAAAIEFESGANLYAYRIEGGGRNRYIHLFLSVTQADFNRTGYSIHLIDPVREASVTSRDHYVSDLWDFLMAPGYVPVYRQWTELVIPADAPTNRALSIVLSLWQDDGDEFLKQRIRSSDHQLLSDTQVVLDALVLPAKSPPPLQSAPLASFDNGFMLDAVTMPQNARAGETLTIPFTWRADTPSSEEYAQFLHIGNEESGEWWVYDQQPLGARLPTRYWYSGLVDTEIWEVPLPADLPPGRYSVFTGLYRVSDKERLSATQPDGTRFVDARVPLGILTIEGDD